MSWGAVGLSVVLAASPSPAVSARRLNVEPIVLAAAGALAAGLGAWRLTVADAHYRALFAIPLMASSPGEAARLLLQAQDLTFRGKSETLAGTLLLATGGAVIAASLVWLLVEGFDTQDWLVAPAPQGVALVGRF